MTPTLKIRRKLKDRLNARQRAKREERMAARSTWRGQMIEGVNRGFGAVSQVVNNNQQLNDRRQRVNMVAFVLMSLVLAYLLGRTAGLW